MAFMDRSPTSEFRESKQPVSIREKWDKFKDEDEKLDEKADNLYSEIRRSLDSALKGNGLESLEAIEMQVEKFLKSEEQEDIDDCIRWLILMKAVETFEPALSEEKGNCDLDNTIFRLIRIILKMAPHLAFQTPTKPINGIASWNEYSIQQRCNNPNHSKRRLLGTTPFHTAAEKGYSYVIEYMLKRGKEGLLSNVGGHLDPLDYVKILQQPKPSRGSNYRYSALGLAAMSEAGSLETVKALLNYDINIATPADDTFVTCLKDGQVSIVNEFLEYEGLQKIYVTAENILLAIEFLTKSESESATLQDATPEDYMKIVCTLIRYARTQAEINNTVVKKIIELDLGEAWGNRRKGINLDTSGLLHIAVQCQNPGFVRMFMDEYPNSVITQSDKKYALWHNNYLVSEERRSDEELKSESVRNSGSQESERVKNKHSTVPIIDFITKVI